jgi:aspartate/methionine/tyrosine aminotransferase
MGWVAGRDEPIFAVAEQAAQLRDAGADVITLAAGEPDASTALHVIEATIAAARDPATHHYGTAAGHSRTARNDCVEGRRRPGSGPGLSKLHAMTGWRVGWMIGPQAVSTTAREQTAGTITHVPLVTQFAALAALHSDTHAAETYRARRDALVQRLNSIPGVRCASVPGGMFAFPDITELIEHRGWSGATDCAATSASTSPSPNPASMKRSNE